jgi:hypothetical protein
MAWNSCVLLASGVIEENTLELQDIPIGEPGC